MRCPLIIASLLGSLACLSANSWAFSIPQPEQDVIASKVAYIQFNAAEGDAQAQYLLGLMYVSGRFVSIDKVQGMSWLQKAAASGDSTAQKTVADLAFEGKLIKRNLALAEHWYLKMAAAGDHWAQFRLGFVYAAGGDGVTRHCGKAVNYFSAVGDDISLGNVAWILATCPEKQFRDGERAVELATQLLKNNLQDPTNLDNLAAAYAELGDFKSAVHTQQQAIAALAAGQARIQTKMDEFRQRLERYQRNKPYREILPLD